MKKALVVGGGSGIGQAVTAEFLRRGYDEVCVVDRNKPEISDAKITFYKENLINENYDVFYGIKDVSALVITAGFGRVAPFESITGAEINNSFKVNVISAIEIIKIFYDKIHSKDDFFCAVMGSITGLVSAPMFSVYSATKAALCSFTESVNIELEKQGFKNRILNVSPGNIKGTKFDGGQNNISMVSSLAADIVSNMLCRSTMYIPLYDEVYGDVIKRYQSNPHKFGLESYDYKIKGGRINLKPQCRIGYLSGTFDLFHIGHLNILKRAKEYCDYLVVGVHKDASHKGKKTFISFDERLEIVKSCKYVDKAIMSMKEDVDVYDNIIKYNLLFVGSDYKGSERFNRYEEYFKDKDVEIVYFPYTKGTSSSQLRIALSK